MSYYDKSVHELRSRMIALSELVNDAHRAYMGEVTVRSDKRDLAKKYWKQVEYEYEQAKDDYYRRLRVRKDNLLVWAVGGVIALTVYVTVLTFFVIWSF